MLLEAGVSTIGNGEDDPALPRSMAKSEGNPSVGIGSRGAVGGGVTGTTAEGGGGGGLEGRVKERSGSSSRGMAAAVSSLGRSLPAAELTTADELAAVDELTTADELTTVDETRLDSELVASVDEPLAEIEFDGPGEGPADGWGGDGDRADNGSTSVPFSAGGMGVDGMERSPSSSVPSKAGGVVNAAPDSAIVSEDGLTVVWEIGLLD